MTLWLAFALMTAAAIFAVLWPLGRRASARVGGEVAVYRDQLDEIARDQASGLIPDAEAEAARIEVSRRLIAAADKTEAQPTSPDNEQWRRRAAALAGLIALPIGAAALYLLLGSPQLPGEPLAARRQAPVENSSVQNLVAQAEAHIERNPDDGRGWEVLAPVYFQLGRFEDAVKARRRAIALNGETAERQADLGEAMVGAANGVVTADAKAAFEQALSLDPKNSKSRFFIGLAAEQDGHKEKAADIWRSMLAGAPPNAPWTAMVNQALARLNPPPATTPGPNAADVAAASQMSEAERGQMIQGMVSRLAARLAQDGSDLEGWLRLVRAYMVLGERDKARAAASDARKALAADPTKIQRLDQMVKGMGLEG